jgi:O-antigen/teichoic acid export membrane protein
MSNSKRALTSGVWYVISNFIINAAVFITTPIFTRLLTHSEVGAFSNFTSWLSMLIIIATFNIPASVYLARFDYRDNLNEYIGSGLVLSSSITMVFFIVMLLFKDFFLNLMAMDFFTFLVMFIYILVYPALQMYQLKWRIEYKYKLSVALSLVATFFSIIFSLILTLLMESKLNGRILGYYTPLIGLNAVIYIIILTRVKNFSTKYWKYAIGISFPLIWHMLAAQLLTSSDKVMITRMLGEEANALYSISYTCGLITSILWSSMNTAWSPWAYEQMDEKNYDALKRASKPYTLFFGAIAFLILLVAPELLLIMGGKSYLAAIYVIPPVVIGYVFQFVYSLYVNIEFYHKKQKLIAFGTIFAALLNIGLNVLCLPRFGYIAAAYTTLAGYIALFCIHYYFVRRMKKDSWYDTRFFIIFLCISLISIWLIDFIYRFTLVRYSIIAVLFVLFLSVIVLFREELKAAFKNKSIKPIKDRLFRNARNYRL